MTDYQRRRPAYLCLDFLDDIQELEDPRPLYVHRQMSSACLPNAHSSEWNKEKFGPREKQERADTLSLPRSQKRHLQKTLSLDENMSTAQLQNTPQRKIRPLPPVPSSSRPRPRPLPTPPLTAPPLSAPAILPPLCPRPSAPRLTLPPRSESLPTYRRQKFFIVCNPDPEPEPNARLQSPPPRQISPHQPIKLHLTIPNSTPHRSLSIKISPVSTNSVSPVIFHVPDAPSPLVTDDDRPVDLSRQIGRAISDKLLYGEAKITDDDSDHESTSLGEFKHPIYVETPIHLNGILWDGKDSDHCEEDDDDDDAVDNGDDGEEEWEFADGMMIHVGRHSSLISKKWVREQGNKRWTQDDYGEIINALRMLRA